MAVLPASESYCLLSPWDKGDIAGWWERDSWDRKHLNMATGQRWAEEPMETGMLEVLRREAVGIVQLLGWQERFNTESAEGPWRWHPGLAPALCHFHFSDIRSPCPRISTSLLVLERTVAWNSFAVPTAPGSAWSGGSHCVWTGSFQGTV